MCVCARLKWKSVCVVRRQYGICKGSGVCYYAEYFVVQMLLKSKVWNTSVCWTCVCAGRMCLCWNMCVLEHVCASV